MTSMDPTRQADSVCRDDQSANLPTSLKPFRFARIVPDFAERAIPVGEHGAQRAWASRVESIHRDLGILSESAEALLAGSKRAERQLRNVLAASGERFRGSAARHDYDYGLVSAIVQLGDDLAVSPECRAGIAGRVRALQATFALDFAAASHDLALTRSAHRMMRQSLEGLRGTWPIRHRRP